MSGIAGIFYRNNKPVQLEQLQAMGTALAHRGPDGINYYCKDSVGFVHCMLHDTPESLFETLPNKTEDEKFVLTFHGRIDNRQELYDKIGWVKPLSAVTDSDLVLASYRKWRKECDDYLLGDFAFAVWDQANKKLFCSRDHMGVKSFYYYLSETLFVFASEIKGIFVLSEVIRVLNDERIADYLTSIILDNESTFYKNIFRLPPGHYLEISSGKTIKRRYHQFCPATLNCKNEGEYEEQFREIFIDAVRVRLRSDFPVGSLLSGGLDSTSIVCTAAGLLGKEICGKLHTFSGIFNKISSCDEREYFSSVIERYGVTSHVIPVDEIHPAVAYEKLIYDEDEPFMAPHIFMNMGLLPLVRKAGVRVLLDGHDGDAAVSYGYSLLAELAFSGKIFRLAQHYKKIGGKSYKSLGRRIMLLYWYIFCNTVPVFLPFSPRRKEIENSVRKLNPEFLNRTRARERLLAATKTLPKFGQREDIYHLKNITQPLHPLTLELFDRIMTREGIVPRYPYFDKRVIDFCLGLPASEKLRDGLNRSIVRRALGDLLPESISERRNKTDFTPSMLHAFREMDGGWLPENIDIIVKASYGIIDEKLLLQFLSAFKFGGQQEGQPELINLIVATVFSRWWAKQIIRN